MFWGAFIGIANAAAATKQAKLIADQRARESRARYDREYQEWRDKQAGVIDIGPDDVRVVPETKLLKD
ncbi:hypothetical protein HTY52_22795 [Cupriavidus taiwanensis]|uniref:hypothetical protein n=1 Tax=Cupriavidus taiwanensis TaxID=164546 RepID=UPI0015743861|nr:hypothetical protein [Cupriavidus taiwanensis]NSX16924.1 hypothetical protein [Cupriavidus taiwanensis]